MNHVLLPNGGHQSGPARVKRPAAATREALAAQERAAANLAVPASSSGAVGLS